MTIQLATSQLAESANNFIDLTTACIAVIITLSGVVVYLHKRLEVKNELFINELRDSNQKLSEMLTSYNKFLDKLDRINEALAEKK